MKDLQDATQQICDLKGSLLALDTLMTALLDLLSREERTVLLDDFARNAEVARTVLLNTSISEFTLLGFERDTKRIEALIRAA